MQTYSVGFAFCEDDVLLIHKLKGPEVVRGRLNGVGGKIEPDEDPTQCMAREFEEETGLHIEEGRWWLKVVLTFEGEQEIVYFFSTHVTDEEALNARSMEIEQIEWCSASRLPENVVPNLRWLIPLARTDRLAFPIVLEERAYSSAS